MALKLQEWMNGRHGCLLGLTAVAIAVFHRPLGIVVGSSFWTDQYAQILVVPPVSALLFYVERKRVLHKVAYSALGMVLYLACMGVFVVVSGRAAAIDPSLYLCLSIVLFAGCCISAFLFCFGLESFRVAVFPLFFLVLMAPWPDVLRNRVIVFLQYGSALVTDWFFTVANIPFSRTGVVIMLPTVTIEIAQECSGIRSSLVLVLAGLVLGHLFLTNMWSKVALLALLIPLTIIKNALRIFTLTTLGMYVDPSFLIGRLHHQGGIVFFALSFAGLWGIVWVLQKAEGRLGAKSVPQS